MEPGNRFFLALAMAFLLRTTVASSEPVVVRHVEGLVHGFLSLRSPEGGVLASGDLIQDARVRCTMRPPCFPSVGIFN